MDELRTRTAPVFAMAVLASACSRAPTPTPSEGATATATTALQSIPPMVPTATVALPASGPRPTPHPPTANATAPSAAPAANACACAHGCFVNGRGQLLTTSDSKLDCCWEPAAWEAQGGLSQAELMKVLANDFGGKVPADWHVATCSLPAALRRR